MADEKENKESMKEAIDTLNHFFQIKDIPKNELNKIVKSDEFKPVIESVEKKLKGIKYNKYYYEYDE